MRVLGGRRAPRLSLWAVTVVLSYLSELLCVRRGTKHKGQSDASVTLGLASQGGVKRNGNCLLGFWTFPGSDPRLCPGPMTLPVSEQVHNHFRRYEVEYLQFAFRWMNNLLMRELPLRCTIRLWDTYQVRRDPLPLRAVPGCPSPGPG